MIVELFPVLPTHVYFTICFKKSTFHNSNFNLHNTFCKTTSDDVIQLAAKFMFLVGLHVGTAIFFFTLQRFRSGRPFFQFFLVPDCHSINLPTLCPDIHVSIEINSKILPWKKLRDWRLQQLSCPEREEVAAGRDQRSRHKLTLERPRAGQMDPPIGFSDQKFEAFKQSK